MFENTFPKYLVMGMTYEQYWEGNPHLAVAYRKAYRLRREADNEYAWLQGLYFCNAIDVCLANAFGKSGSPKKNYIERPVDIYPPTKAQKKKREREEQEKMRRTMEEMIRMQQRRKQKGD